MQIFCKFPQKTKKKNISSFLFFFFFYSSPPFFFFRQLIQQLVEKWRLDHKTLIMDESQYEFNAYFLPIEDKIKYIPTVHKQSIYGPITTTTIIHNEEPKKISLPEPIYIPKPSYPVNLDGKTYIPPPPLRAQASTPVLYHQNLTDHHQSNINPLLVHHENHNNPQIDYNIIKFMNQPYQFRQNYYTGIGAPKITMQETPLSWNR